MIPAELGIKKPKSDPAGVSRSRLQQKLTEQHVQSITVPVMGEGIRNAKIVSLLKKPGEQIQLDDELCEVETDKAVYPIQSSFAGVMGEWKTKVGDTVEIGQELGTIVTSEPAFAEQFETAAKESPHASEAAGVDRGRAATEASGKKTGRHRPRLQRSSLRFRRLLRAN